MALATARVSGGAIPADLTSFVGREHELSEVRRCLSAGRLVTLTGPGGVGKSRLALRAAAERRRAFQGGVWLVELTDLRDPELLDRVVAAAIGVTEHSGQPPLGTLIEWLGTERVLLLLDNCEHLLDACAEVTTRLLRACPGLRILATSREPLNVAGEMTLTVPPLTLPPVRLSDLQVLPSVSTLGQYGAVSLFVDRATAVLPTFRLTGDNCAAVAGVCHRLDGLPLAIELAAVRLRVLTPEQLLERLADRYRVLAKAQHGGQEHQQTLRASIDWSFALCTPQEQRLWARLAVFSGGFELDAVEAICSDEAVPGEAMLDLVAGLIDKSILSREEYRYGVRYRMLESFREYAVEKLAEHGESAQLACRHRNWHEQLMRRVNSEWISQRQEYWLERLPHEHPNLRVTFDYCRSAAGGAEAALRILVAIPPAYLWARNLLGETRDWLVQILAGNVQPGPLRARGLLLAAQLAIAQGDLDAAAGPLAEGRQLAQQYKDPAALAFAGYASANAAMYAGDLAAALTFFAEALTACESLDTLNQRLDVLLGLAIASGLGGDEQRAVACHEQIVALTKPLNERFNRSNSLWALGLAAWRQGDRQRSAELQRQALRLKWEIDDRLGA
ncbi:MAG TPA: AAA family ATPase, partial [Kineosporiaceae bacterium]|nr:AAA family ATPase [Kineosporiaceae bacterium]